MLLHEEVPDSRRQSMRSNRKVNLPPFDFGFSGSSGGSCSSFRHSSSSVAISAADDLARGVLQGEAEHLDVRFVTACNGL
jgi:hypothetical protein